MNIHLDAQSIAGIIISAGILWAGVATGFVFLYMVGLIAMACVLDEVMT